jgi:hypothetical protein
MTMAINNTREIAQAVSVSPSDSVNIGASQFYLWNRIFVGTSATNVVLVLEDGTTLTFTNIAQGVWHFMPPFKRVNQTNTTATGIVAGQSFGR